MHWITTEVVPTKWFHYGRIEQLSKSQINIKANQTSMQNLIFTFSRLKLLPRMMIDVSSRNMKTSVLGTEISMPIGIAPTAMQKMAHPEGECAAAKAAEKAGTLFIMSTISTSSIEEVAQAAPNALKWFQLYIYKDRQVHFLPYFFKLQIKRKRLLFEEIW